MQAEYPGYLTHRDVGEHVASSPNLKLVAVPNARHSTF